MQAGIDPLGAANMGVAAAVAAQSAIDAAQGNHGISTNAAQAVGITAAVEGYDLSGAQIDAIGAAIADETQSWGSA